VMQQPEQGTHVGDVVAHRHDRPSGRQRLPCCLRVVGWPAEHNHISGEQVVGVIDEHCAVPADARPRSSRVAIVGDDSAPPTVDQSGHFGTYQAGAEQPDYGVAAHALPAVRRDLTPTAFLRRDTTLATNAQQPGNGCRQGHCDEDATKFLHEPLPGTDELRTAAGNRWG
jgi:hypothetical protein